MKLYELTDDYNRAFSELSEMLEAGDIDQETMEASLSAIEGEFSDKAVSVGYRIKNLQGALEAVKSEIERLTSLKTAYSRDIDWLKGYLLRNMLASDIKSIPHPTLPIKVTKGRPSVVIGDIDKLPAAYVHEEVTRKADKRALLYKLKNGSVEGAHLETNPSIKL